MRSRPRARGAGFSTGPALYGAFSAPLTIWGRLSRMKIIPPGFHGRCFAITRTLMQSGGPLGGVSAGFAVPLLGLRAGLAAIALITCAIGAGGWRLPSYDGRGEQVASRARCGQTQPTGTGLDGKFQSMERLKKTIERLYTGRSRRAAFFRYVLIGFDLFTIVFFIITTPLAPMTDILVADFAIGTLILADFLARLWIAPSKLRMLRQIYTITDVLVILSLLLAPLITQNLAFLRVLRTLRLLHSYHVLRDLRRDTPFFRRNEDVIVSSVNLGVFIFFMTALVFVLQFGDNPNIGGYIDALYFTVATLTTTGFGDITLTGTLGRLLAIVIMVAGVALFLRLAQTIFRPQKLSYTCPDCGLTRHEPDSIHCKHCGHALKIETEGAG